ncbi:MAG: aminotransferase class IV [Acidimicrobiales bacterium]|jgi:branched-chain amino acid aminotransferase|nr:aminotransferase class IV [Acidimicrobiales bacterium]
MTGNGDILWINGRLQSAGDGGLSPFDHGVTVGDGAFETAKVVRGEAFALTRHLARLRRSAAGLHLSVPFSDDELRDAVREVIAANGDRAGRLRITLTGGEGPLGSERSESTPTLMIATAPLKPWDPSGRVVVVPWRRNEHSPVAGLKTTSYAENVVALRHAHQHGAGEAIFANTAGNLCEGTGSNIFVGLDGRLVTPPLSSGCLAGIVRELLVELVEVHEEDLPIERLGEVDEAFLTSSTRNVQPISHVDERTLPACPGPLTEAAAAALDALEARTTDP